ALVGRQVLHDPAPQGGELPCRLPCLVGPAPLMSSIHAVCASRFRLGRRTCRPALILAVTGQPRASSPASTPLSTGCAMWKDALFWHAPSDCDRCPEEATLTTRAGEDQPVVHRLRAVLHRLAACRPR